MKTDSILSTINQWILNEYKTIKSTALFGSSNNFSINSEYYEYYISNIICDKVIFKTCISDDNFKILYGYDQSNYYNNDFRIPLSDPEFFETLGRIISNNFLWISRL